MTDERDYAETCVTNTSVTVRRRSAAQRKTYCYVRIPCALGGVSPLGYPGMHPRSSDYRSGYVVTFQNGYASLPSDKYESLVQAVRDADALAAILTDLIAELRHHCGEVCRCDIAQSADRTESRLREVTGE